jgi:transcription initiation factor TFIIB
MAVEIIPKYHSNPKADKESELSCVHSRLIADDNVGEIFCSQCGTVIQDRIDDGKEFGTNFFNDYFQMNRGGLLDSLTLFDRGLTTVINKKNIDFSGKPLKGKIRYEFDRLRIWDSRSKFKTKDKTMEKAFLNLDTISKKLGISKRIQELVAYLYRKAIVKISQRGRNQSALIAASVYVTCRQLGIPRSLRSVAIASNLTKKDLSRYVRLILKDFDFQLLSYSPSLFLSKICGDVGLNEKTKRYAQNILEKAEKIELFAGRNPIVICAAVIFLSCIKNGEHRTQDQIAKSAGVTTVSIRNSISFLLKRLHIESLQAS